MMHKIELLIVSVAKEGSIEWSRHSLERMLERGISRRLVIDVFETGELLESYPDDYPYPSVLMFKKNDGLCIHVVAAYNPDTNVVYVVTAYYPDLVHFHADGRRRRL